MITAEIIQDSISPYGKRITTFSLEYPRFIHSELMTHRVFSRNAASSRAIPIGKMMDQVISDPAMPVSWGMNQAGMQAGEEHNSPESCMWAWRQAASSAVKSATMLDKMGLHKQIVNRVLEPFQRMKTIVTSTEMDNFFALRCHPDAQPEIQVLAKAMYTAMAQSKPMELKVGEWHVPYVGRYRCPEYDNLIYFLDNDDQTDLTLDEALMVSSSCCAQVSYRVLDDTLEKAKMIYDKLVNSKPMHASPFEHQAKPSNGFQTKSNFKGFIQNRYYIENS